MNLLHYFRLLPYLARCLANSLPWRSRHSSILSAITRFQVQQHPLLVWIKQLSLLVSQSPVFCSTCTCWTSRRCTVSALVRRWLPSLLSQDEIPGSQVSPNLWSYFPCSHLRLVQLNLLFPVHTFGFPPQLCALYWQVTVLPDYHMSIFFTNPKRYSLKCARVPNLASGPLQKLVLPGMLPFPPNFPPLPLGTILWKVNFP